MDPTFVIKIEDAVAKEGGTRPSRSQQDDDEGQRPPRRQQKPATPPKQKPGKGWAAEFASILASVTKALKWISGTTEDRQTDKEQTEKQVGRKKPQQPITPPKAPPKVAPKDEPVLDAEPADQSAPSKTSERKPQKPITPQQSMKGPQPAADTKAIQYKPDMAGNPDADTRGGNGPSFFRNLTQMLTSDKSQSAAEGWTEKLGGMFKGGGKSVVAEGAAGGAAAGGAAAGGLEALAGPIAIVVMVLKKGLDGAAIAMQEYAKIIKLITREMVAEFRGDMLSAEMIRRERYFSIASGSLKAAGSLEPSGLMSKSAVIVDEFGKIWNAKTERIQQMDLETRQRAKQLAGYSGQIAATQARGEVQGIKRDIGEASILGPNYARLGEVQQKFDLVQQQVKIAKAIETMNDQAEATAEKTEKYQKELAELLKKLPKGMADEIKKLGQQESPFEQWKKGIRMPDLPNPQESEEVRRGRLRMGIPGLRDL